MLFNKNTKNELEVFTKAHDVNDGMVQAAVEAQFILKTKEVEFSLDSIETIDDQESNFIASKINQFLSKTEEEK